MYALYHAYQAYERRMVRGELDRAAIAHRAKRGALRLPFAYRLGERLVCAGLKLQRRALAGHALASTTMAER
jgi:hypothetical protein